MAFTQKSSWIYQQKQEENVVELLEKMEQIGKWPQQACTTMLFFDTEECHG